VAGAIEQGNPEPGLEIGDGVADGRLDAGQPAAPERKLPLSATTTKVRIWSRVKASIMIDSIDQFDAFYITFSDR
jgi:hypothetical protein